MPRFNVNAPDGSIIPVDAPAGATEQDAIAFAASIWKPTAAPVKTGVDAIPGQRVQAPPAQTATPVRREGGMLGQTLGGLIETPLALVANSVSGPVTYLSGALGPDVQRKVAGAIQYEPRTQMAQETLEAIASNPVVQKLPPFTPGSNLSRSLGPAARATADALRAEGSLVRESIAAPLAARAEKTQLQRVRESQVNAPRIDAAKDALELGIALDPAVSNPTKGNVLKSRLVGTGNLDAKLAEQNLPKYTSAAKRDMGLPDTVKLDADGFEQARSAPEISTPYETVRNMSSLTPDTDTFSKLDSLRVSPLIGDTGQAAAANTLLDAVKQQLSSGVDGRTLVDSIRQRRREAQAIYNQQSKGVNPPSPEALAKADMNMGVANVLEGMIENNISNNPTLLGDFRNARVAMAKTYDYERATNFATGNIDPQIIAKMAAEGKPMSGTLAKIGNVAANFPEVSRANVSGKTPWGEKLTRSSPGGTAGALAGSVFGLPGSIAGGVVGAVGGNILTGMEARRMATPAYQARNAVPKDYRPPVNNLRPAEINYGPNQLAVFDPRNAVFMPGEVPYQPNFTRVDEPIFSTSFGQQALPNEVPRQVYEAQKRAELAQGFRETAERKPASGEVILDFDPVTGRYREASQGIKGATPETFQRLSALDDAAKKVTEGKLFDLTATEKVAWDKATVDIKQLGEGFAKLDDKAIAQKMMDRKWVEGAITKARQQEQAFADIAARAADERIRQAAMAKREQMMDLLSTLEAQYAKPRPTSSGVQGPKTREANRNKLRGVDNRNNLVP